MKNISDKWLRRFVGFAGERDEYQEKMIYKVLGNANVLTFYLLSVGMLASFIWDALHDQISLGTVMLFLIQQINSVYTLHHLKKYKANQTDFYDEESFVAYVKQLKKKFSLIGLQWGVWMFVWLHIIFPFLYGDPVDISLFDVGTIVVSSILFGVLTYYFSKSKLRLINE